ncbi:hypothetical protein B0H21DRAFT_868651 [Amylocystis lapponica]|nr:hypothetical protein B0H21DRAFT_868651 [Amylocystis lapponica]
MAISLDFLRPSETPHLRLPSASPPPRQDARHSADQPSRSSLDRHLAARTPFLASASTDISAQAAYRPSDRSLLYPSSAGYAQSSTHSLCSTATNTPLPSRTPSPAAYSSGASSSSSGSESELESPFLGDVNGLRHRPPWRNQRRWWVLGAAGPRRRRESRWGWRPFKRALRLLFRQPFVPKTPVTILLALVLLTAFGVSLTFLLIYILNPDKEPLPWRGYCTIPRFAADPPSLFLPPTASFPYPLPDDFEPQGVLLGVFSVDNAVERRMLVRSTWASHNRSRNGAGAGDDGVGTSRTVVRFILGQPSQEWTRRIQLEAEMFNDMVILPVRENMNSGKSHEFFAWAAADAWVPPLYFDDFAYPDGLSYVNATTPAPPPATHDSMFARQDFRRGAPRDWVRPDFVVKTDDDSFVMLAELEARLRVELHTALQAQQPHAPVADATMAMAFAPPAPVSSPAPAANATLDALLSDDPLVFWGYLVKNRFMAGELYALSTSLVHWIAHDPQIKAVTKGAEDKQTAKWMRLHPRAGEVRWASERCWIYDHPRAGTVYSHGFLFPSEAKRVQRAVMEDIELSKQHDFVEQGAGAAFPSPFGPNAPTPPAWAYSTVSRFGTHYAPPLPDLLPQHSVEALVEGSEMSRLHEGSAMAPWHAWKYREGRAARFLGQRVGGTVVVHFIKKNMWFLEAAMAMLEGEDVTENERTVGPAPAPAPDSSAVVPVPTAAATDRASHAPARTLTTHRHRRR